MLLIRCQRSRKLRMLKQAVIFTVLIIFMYRLYIQMPAADLTFTPVPVRKYNVSFTSNVRTFSYRHLLPRKDLENKVNFDLNVYQFANGSWAYDEKFCKSSETYPKAMLKNISHDIPMYVYAEDEDIWISKSIVYRGEWKGQWIQKMLHLLNTDKELVFIDIGANLGVFTLPAAIAGHRVIAIECLDRTFHRLCSSVHHTNVADRVDLVYNAVSDSHGYAELEILESNKGATKVASVGSEISSHSVPSLLLDDLLSNFNISKAVIKLSVEGHEVHALKGAADFFRTVSVKYVIIEFSAHRRMLSAFKLNDLLKSYGMRPVLPKEQLKAPTFVKWPDTIVWEQR